MSRTSVTDPAPRAASLGSRLAALGSTGEVGGLLLFLALVVLAGLGMAAVAAVVINGLFKGQR